jgi:hypothetical protein
MYVGVDVPVSRMQTSPRCGWGCELLTAPAWCDAYCLITEGCCETFQQLITAFRTDVRLKSPNSPRPLRTRSEPISHAEIDTSPVGGYLGAPGFAEYRRGGVLLTN